MPLGIGGKRWPLGVGGIVAVMAIKYATETIGLRDAQGLAYRVVANEPWDADDPLVKQNPSFFVDQPLQLKRTVRVVNPEPDLPRVEAATHAPGEVRRGPGRPRRS